MASSHAQPHAAAETSQLHERIRKYLPDLILGANDGVITTFAVISAVVGAALSPTVILIMGFANLVGDGLSMAASNVLSRHHRARSGLMRGGATRRSASDPIAQPECERVDIAVEPGSA
jgi:hypothetical protein